MKRSSKEMCLPQVHPMIGQFSVKVKADSTHEITEPYTSEEDIEVTVDETSSLDTMTATPSDHSDNSVTVCSTNLLQESDTSISEDDKNTFLFVNPTDTEELPRNDGQKKYHSKFSEVHSTSIKLCSTEEAASSIKSDSPDVSPKCVPTGSAFRERGDTLNDPSCDVPVPIPSRRNTLIQALNLPITAIQSKNFVRAFRKEELSSVKRSRTKNITLVEKPHTSRNSCGDLSSNVMHNTETKFTVKRLDPETALPECNTPNIKKENSPDLEVLPITESTENNLDKEVSVIEEDNQKILTQVDKIKILSMEELHPDIDHILSSLDKLCVVRKTRRCFYSKERMKRPIHHHVTDREENMLFTAEENVISYKAGCLLDNYIVKVVISDLNNKEVMHMHRSMESMREMMEVWAPPETLVGQIREAWSLFSENFYVLDSNGQVVFRIEGRTNTCRGEINQSFNVMSPDRETRLGRIFPNRSKRMGIEEEDPSFDHFAVTFPSALDKTHKCLLLGACFLVDILNFYCWGI